MLLALELSHSVEKPPTDSQPFNRWQNYTGSLRDMSYHILPCTFGRSQ